MQYRPNCYSGLRGRHHKMFQMKVSSHPNSHPAMITALDLVGPPQYTASVGSHFSTTQASEQYPSTTQSCLLPCPPLLSEVPQSALLLRTHSNDTRVKPAPLSSPTVETKPSSHSFLCDAVTTRPPELASSEAASIKLNPVIPHALQVVSPSTSSMYTVTCSIAKDFLGSAKTRQAILIKRPMSFWA